MENFLYRGVCEEIFKKNKGLAPKGTSFSRAMKYGTGFKYGTITYGSSERNAVVGHQKDSSQFPTSGISTTPALDRAKYYALENGIYSKGFIYKIDRNLLKQFHVREYRVADSISIPEAPEDDEVILVPEDGGALPNGVVVETIEVFVDQKVIRHPQVDLF